MKKKQFYILETNFKNLYLSKTFFSLPTEIYNKIIKRVLFKEHKYFIIIATVCSIINYFDIANRYLHYNLQQYMSILQTIAHRDLCRIV